jgi:hypothetical protein
MRLLEIKQEFISNTQSDCHRLLFKYFSGPSHIICHAKNNCHQRDNIWWIAQQNGAAFDYCKDNGMSHEAKSHLCNWDKKWVTFLLGLWLTFRCPLLQSAPAQSTICQSNIKNSLTINIDSFSPFNKSLTGTNTGSRSCTKTTHLRRWTFI